MSENPTGFTYRGSGVNKEGNHWCSRNYGDNVPNKNPYHYSNRNGSWYYHNPDGSKYYNNGRGGSVYTSPSGWKHVEGYDEVPESSMRGEEGHEVGCGGDGCCSRTDLDEFRGEDTSNRCGGSVDGHRDDHGYETASREGLESRGTQSDRPATEFGRVNTGSECGSGGGTAILREDGDEHGEDFIDESYGQGGDGGYGGGYDGNGYDECGHDYSYDVSYDHGGYDYGYGDDDGSYDYDYGDDDDYYYQRAKG